MNTHLSTVKVNSEHDFNNIEEPRKDSLLWGVEWLCAHHAKYASKEVLYAGLPKSDKLEPEMALRMLDQMGISAGWVKRDLNSISSWLFPLLIARKDGTYCIITARNGKRGQFTYQIVVPENEGILTVSAADLLEVYGGYALVTTPKPSLDARADDLLLPKAQNEGHWLYSTLWRYRHYFYSAALAALLANILTLAGTFFTMNVYDRVIPTQAYVTLWSLAIGVVIANIFEFSSRQIRAYLIDIAGKRQT
ncbi:hypothetical protein PQF84_02695 [Enterobacter hormaechei]|nr:hypothetical protein PQF84_02695 [Enterobacter hormaechei]